MADNGAANERLIWIDLEMTGLDTDNDSIIEIATVVTDAQLNVLAEEASRRLTNYFRAKRGKPLLD